MWVDGVVSEIGMDGRFGAEERDERSKRKQNIVGPRSLSDIGLIENYRHMRQRLVLSLELGSTSLAASL